jgi:hypothetical protein
MTYFPLSVFCNLYAYLTEVHNTSTRFELVCFVTETTERICMKFGIGANSVDCREILILAVIAHYNMQFTCS